MIFSDSGSSRDLIFKILSEEWPLSAKEIYSRVNKSSSKNISYQAVHKTLNFLVEENILEKEMGKYLVNLLWVENSNEQLSKLENNLKEGKVVSPLNQKFVFNSVHEVDQFLVSSCKSLVPNQKDELLLQWIHFWIPLFISKNTYKEMKELIINSNFYSITPNDSSIDKWCAKFWEDIGVKEKIGAKLGFDTSFLVYSDLIIQVFYPLEIREAIDKVYNSTTDPGKLDIDNFFKTVFEKKTKIPVLVSRNKEVAEDLRNQIKAFF
jgi:hypothetical protein